MTAERDTYYKTKEVAELLRISTTTLYRMAKRGELPSPIRLSRTSVRWSKRSIDNLLEARVMFKTPPIDTTNPNHFVVGDILGGR